MSHIALNWLLQRPTVTAVIIGARSEEQLLKNWELWPKTDERANQRP